MVTLQFELENLFEEVLKTKEQKDIEPLTNLVDLLKTLADALTRKTEMRPSQRTMADEQNYLSDLIEKIRQAIVVLTHSPIPTVRQSLFDEIEDRIKAVLEQLNKIIIVENEINNHRYDQIVLDCQITIDRYLQGIYNQIQRLHTNITHKNGDALLQQDFCLMYYQNLYNIHVIEKVQKNNKTRELNNLDIGKKQGEN